jgi:hypothetical protein
MRKVETSDVHAGVEHLDEHVDVPAGGSERANNLGLTVLKLDLLENVLESDATRVGAALCLYHSILTVSSKVCSLSVCVLGLVDPKSPQIKLQ